MQKLIDFIEKDRDRYITDENNRFASSFYKVTRYWGFLLIIASRYEKKSLEWHQLRLEMYCYHKSSTKESIELDMLPISGGGIVNFKVQKFFEDNSLIETTIQLDIESFYLIAKTLLDKIANAIWTYFGKTRRKGCTLSSHDNITKHIEEYATLKSVVIPKGFINQAANLRKIISDFRDWQIAHERDPERNSFSSRMTILDEKDQYLKLRIIRFHSETNKEEISSLRLDTLLQAIDIYTDLVADLLNNNKGLTTYKKNHKLYG